MAWNDLKILKLGDGLWKTTDSSEYRLKIRSNRGAGMILKKFGTHMQQLKLEDPCGYEILPIVGQYCNNLTRLEVDIYSFDKSHAKFFPRMQKLKYFEITGIRCYPREVFQTLPSDTLTDIHLWTYTSGTPYDLIHLGSVPLIAPTVRLFFISTLQLNSQISSEAINVMINIFEYLGQIEIFLQ